VYVLLFFFFLGGFFGTVGADYDKGELMRKAERGELSEEEYEAFIKYGLCKPLKENFLEDRERGWVYGEFCIKENLTRNYRKAGKKVDKKRKDNTNPKGMGITGTGGEIVGFDIDRNRVRDDKYLDSLNAKQFRYLIQELMDEATYNPTPENVENYLYVQDYMGRKAMRFARVWQQVILSNPSLNPYGRFTRNQWEEKIYFKQKIEDRKKFFSNLKKKMSKEDVGIYVFVSGNCKYCHLEMDVIHSLIADYGITVVTVSKDFCPENFPNCRVKPAAFVRFDVSVTPTVVLVVKGSDSKLKFQAIAVGLTSETTLVNRIVYYYKYLKTGKHVDDRTVIWGKEDD